MPIYRTHGNFKTITLQIILLQNLDLTAANRKLIHEGPLTWRIQHIKKTVGVCLCVCVCVCVCVCMCACVCVCYSYIHCYGTALRQHRTLLHFTLK